MNSFPPIKQSFQVPYEYQLHFTTGLFASDNPLLAKVVAPSPKKPIKILVVLDDGVEAAHPDLASQIKTYSSSHGKKITLTEIVTVKGGEAVKVDRKWLDTVLDAINKNGICRHSFVIAIGGGAVIDMVGYAATIAHRGVKLIRVPTTVLAQNDAAVGVKNGINHFGKKNFLGGFSPPHAIINDFGFLHTLEHRDWIAGIAEAVKVAAIKDADFFSFLEANATKMGQRDHAATTHMIYRCAELHMQHIAQGGDPFEGGSSRPLDFGHWAAHKLEQMTNYRLRHGEAVAKGIALDVTYAHLIGLISKTTQQRIVDVLAQIGFDLGLDISDGEETDQLLKGIEEFREHLGGELTITLLKHIGQKHDVHHIDEGLMRKAIKIRRGVNVASF